MTVEQQTELSRDIPGPESRRLMALAEEVEGPTVARQPDIVWQRAQGIHVEDVDGNVYLDFTSSVLVAAVGHGHPRVVEAIREQAGELLHSYNFLNRWRVELEQKLIGHSKPHGLDRIFIATTGSELIEMALKLARWKSGKTGVLALEGGYHGKTMAATAVGGQAKSREGLGEILRGVVHLPFPRVDDEAAERNALDLLAKVDGSEIGTVILEVFQGNAGQRVTSARFLEALQQWARDHGAVLIFDETQSAFGRAGTMFSFEQFPALKPDLVVAGKGISSSLPLTVLFGCSEVFDAAPARALSSTHGGNPMSCRAACVVLDLLDEQRLLDNSREVGAHLAASLREAVASSGLEADVRGTGLMLGISVLDGSGKPDPARAKAIVEQAIRRGLLLLAPIGIDKNVIRVSPPLILSREQASEGAAILAAALGAAA